MNPVTFTLDVEDHVPAHHDPRAPVVTRTILEFCERRDIRGTFFVVGELAAEHPDLVRDIAAGGHELALHAWSHTHLTTMDEPRMRDDLRRGKDLLEDLSGRPVTGFRAPTFSLVPDTVWVTDVLAETGFTYSSSVLPARNPLHGWPGASRVPFRWDSGVVELPCPVASIGSHANPYLGGIYLRLLPWWLIDFGLRRSAAGEVLWLYCHPYDFDPDEPFSQRPDLSRHASRLQWLNRKRMFRRVERLMTATGIAPPLGERAHV